MATAPTRERATDERTSEFSSLLDRQMASRPELLQMRMENETIMAECRAEPRNLADCRQSLADLLAAFPEFAADAIYRRPVGKDEEGGDRQKFAEGLSIRAAEALAEAYKYNRVRGDVSRVDPNTVKVEATFTDFATGRIWQEGRLVSQLGTRSRGKGGGQYRIDDQRFTEVVVQAAKSKAIREVICRSVNPALKAWFETECRRITSDLLTEAKVEEIFSGFAKLKVDAATVEKLVGRPRSMGWTKDDRLTLHGIFNALRSGETTVQELLATAHEDEQPQSDAPKPGGKTLDDIASQGKAKQPDAKLQSAPQSSPKPEAPQSTANEAASPATSKWEVFVGLLKQCTSEADARRLYDVTFGPDSSISWTTEQDGEAARLVAEHVAALPKTSKPTKGGK